MDTKNKNKEVEESINSEIRTNESIKWTEDEWDNFNSEHFI